MPEERIAQAARADRDAARLMVLHREGRRLTESVVSDLPALLRSGDCLVLNDTRVSPCRFQARIGGISGGEILAVRREFLSETECEFDAMVYPGKRFKVGVKVSLLSFSSNESGVEGEVLAVTEIGRLIRLRSAAGPILPAIQAMGRVPFPPYITNADIPPDRYQTCFAKDEGSTAAPTAGLHFTPDLFRRLAASGVRVVFLTLHVGPGTFRPVTSRELVAGRLHPEPYFLSEEAAEEIRRAKSTGGRLIAVGTTVCRTLEHVAAKFGEVRADSGVTGLFIREGFSFRAVDGLLTNFHLPKTSLLMLVSALAGREWLMEAYREAVRRKFNFYSFGDAMLIL